MKITRTNYDVMVAKARRKVATAGCKVCPCCGETKPVSYYIKKGNIHKGVMSGLVTQFSKGFFKPTSYAIQHYHCFTCGAEWRSEPYEV